MAFWPGRPYRLGLWAFFIGMKKQIATGYDAGRWIFDAYARRKISFQAIAFGFYLLDLWNRRRKSDVFLTPTDASIDLGISRDSASKYWNELEAAGLFRTVEIVGQARAKRIEFTFDNAEDNAEKIHFVKADNAQDNAEDNAEIFRTATYIEKKIRKDKIKNKQKSSFVEIQKDEDLKPAGIDEFSAEIIQPENESWLFNLAQAIGGKSFILPALEKFVIFAKGNGRKYESKIEFQRHFFNWATIPTNQKKFQNNENTNSKNGFSANLNDWARRAYSSGETSAENFDF